MPEYPRDQEPFSPESLESRKERLRSVLGASLEVFRGSEKSIREGALTVVQRPKSGGERVVSDLVVMSIDDEAVEFGAIEEDGEIGPSASMEWIGTRLRTPKKERGRSETRPALSVFNFQI